MTSISNLFERRMDGTYIVNADENESLFETQNANRDIVSCNESSEQSQEIASSVILAGNWDNPRRHQLSEEKTVSSLGSTLNSTILAGHVPALEASLPVTFTSLTKHKSTKDIYSSGAVPISDNNSNELNKSIYVSSKKDISEQHDVLSLKGFKDDSDVIQSTEENVQFKDSIDSTKYNSLKSLFTLPKEKDVHLPIIKITPPVEDKACLKVQSETDYSSSSVVSSTSKLSESWETDFSESEKGVIESVKSPYVRCIPFIDDCPKSTPYPGQIKSFNTIISESTIRKESFNKCHDATVVKLKDQSKSFLSVLNKTYSSGAERNPETDDIIPTRYLQKFASSPEAFTRKLVTIIEESIMECDSGNKSGMSLSKFTKEFKKMCKFIEDESVPEGFLLCDTNLSMQEEKRQNYSVEVESHERTRDANQYRKEDSKAAFSNIVSAQPHFLNQSPDKNKKMDRFKFVQSNKVWNDLSPKKIEIDKELNNDSISSFLEWENLCNALYSDQECPDNSQPSTPSVEFTSCPTESDTYLTASERQMSLLMIESLVENENIKKLSGSDILKNKKSPNTEQFYKRRLNSLNRKATSSKDDQGSYSEKELTANTLLELRKKRQRCFDAAKAASAITEKCTIDESEEFAGRQKSDVPKSLQCNAKFERTLSICAGYYSELMNTFQSYATVPPKVENLKPSEKTKSLLKSNTASVNRKPVKSVKLVKSTQRVQLGASKNSASTEKGNTMRTVSCKTTLQRRVPKALPTEKTKQLSSNVVQKDFRKNKGLNTTFLQLSSKKRKAEHVSPIFKDGKHIVMKTKELNEAKSERPQSVKATRSPLNANYSPQKLPKNMSPKPLSPLVLPKSRL
ncbi:uncharacterized protein LOC105701504, partial [Orussus abietinus]|uniref:uncharacterized protein LOC105701504 n=1 Tax=Orussus abietinus TaxID=222816 RepID=UPI000C715C35